MLGKLFSGSNTADKAIAFKEYLTSKDVAFEEYNEESNGSYAFAFNQRLECGPIARFVATFNDKRTAVTSYMFNYITIQDTSKLPNIHSLINQLNGDYIFTTLYESENEISLKYAIDIDKFFDPETVMNQMLMMMNVAEESYSDFMKAIWS